MLNSGDGLVVRSDSGSAGGMWVTDSIAADEAPTPARKGERSRETTASNIIGGDAALKPGLYHEISIKKGKLFP